MKKNMLLFSLLVLLTGFTKAQNVNIPDANFKACLVGNAAINTNQDSEIQVSEAEAFEGDIYCPNLNITDLTGIEAFVKVKSINVRYNQLTSLDVSKNTALASLYADDNSLTGLDVSKNTALTSLYADDNSLTSLDVSQNTLLDVLYVPRNQLTGLDVSKNTALAELYVDNNSLTGLDVSQNILLIELHVSGNQLIVLNLKQNTLLEALNVAGNQLTSLNLKNGNNTLLGSLDARINPNLSCIQVDDVAAANAMGGSQWRKDATVSYSEDCNAVLPVTLVAFTAKADENRAKLQWQTTSEVNNKGFEVWRKTEVESSADGFVKIGEVPPTFNPQLSTFSYSYIDKNPANGNNYYKLLQVDNDGKINELGLREVSFGFEAAAISLYPNPTANLLNLTFAPDSFTQLQVTDVSGKVLQRIAINTTDSSKQILLGALPAGVIW